MDRKKRLKEIKSLEKQKAKHIEKMEAYNGKDYTRLDYWESEIRSFDEQIAEEKAKLKKKDKD